MLVLTAVGKALSVASVGILCMRPYLWQRGELGLKYGWKGGWKWKDRRKMQECPLVESIILSCSLGKWAHPWHKHLCWGQVGLEEYIFDAWGYITKRKY